MKRQIINRINKYHFEWKHILVLFTVLILFQVIISIIHNASLKDLINQTQDWYKKDSAEKLANLTTTSLELLLQIGASDKLSSEKEKDDLIQSFNIILNQQRLQQNVRDICILVPYKDDVFAIDNGKTLYAFMYEDLHTLPEPDMEHLRAQELYRSIAKQIHQMEQIYTLSEGNQIFHVYVPIVPFGEYAGALYMEIAPDLGFLTDQIKTRYTESMIIFSGLILFGLLAMFFISAYTVKERNEAQQLLFREREKNLKEQFNHQKETQFTKRIYHTHHKAEKVMGFITQDIERLSEQNIEETRARVTKYASFISQVIYDMKWYDPPLQTIYNPIFNTNINDVIRFITEHIFLRVVEHSERFKINLDLDSTLPNININEYVTWEIIEPLIQNSIDHAEEGLVTIQVQTRYDAESGSITIVVEDDGKGIVDELLQKNENGIKKIFLENISTKSEMNNSGYGCYLSYEISKRCGWHIDVENKEKGCRFELNFKR